MYEWENTKRLIRLAIETFVFFQASVNWILHFGSLVTKFLHATPNLKCELMVVPGPSFLIFFSRINLVLNFYFFFKYSRLAKRALYRWTIFLMEVAEAWNRNTRVFFPRLPRDRSGNRNVGHLLTLAELHAYSATGTSFRPSHQERVQDAPASTSN